MVYARAKRVLGRDSIVIVDGMNYIKGWRYQLWCEAKAAGTTCCVVCLSSIFFLFIFSLGVFVLYASSVLCVFLDDCANIQLFRI